MAKEEWFIYIQDHDRKQSAFAGPVLAAQVYDWIDGVVQEKEKGRELYCQEVSGAHLNECKTHASSNGLAETDAEKLVSPPRDRRDDYRGKLPNYASKADRTKVVQVLCKGKCGAVRWAEMNISFPGEKQLGKAKMGVYKATCLRCGSIAMDNYNWYR